MEVNDSSRKRYTEFMNNERRSEHIQRGGAALIPQERMRRIRWEECVVMSKNKRAKKPAKGGMIHWDCTCGEIDCLANPTISHYFRDRVPGRDQ